jgi:hypothetical protein
MELNSTNEKSISHFLKKMISRSLNKKFSTTNQSKTMVAWRELIEAEIMNVHENLFFTNLIFDLFLISTLNMFHSLKYVD